jgi:hypothetical protein
MAVSHIKSDTIADFTGTFTGFNSQGSTTTIAATDVVLPSDWNSAHNQFYTLTGNTVGNSTASGTNVLFAGSGGVSLGGSTGTVVISAPNSSSLVGTNGIGISTNGSTITMSAIPVSMYAPGLSGSTANITYANGTAYFVPLYLSWPLGVNRIAMLQQHTSQSVTTYFASGSVSSQTSSGGTGSWGQSGTWGVFSRKATDQTNADYSRILSFISGTYTHSYGVSQSASWSTNASSATVSVTMSNLAGFLSQINSAGAITTTNAGTSYSTSFSSTSTNQNSFSSSFSDASTSGSRMFSGMRPVYFPMATTVLSPGDYWLMHIQSTTSGSTNNSRLDRYCMQADAGYLAYQTSNQGVLPIGSSTTLGSTNYMFGIGSHSASSASTTTMALTAISSLASNMSQYFMAHGQTL